MPKGMQLSVLVEVPPYPLENPPQRGDLIQTSSGTATVTHIRRAGKADITFADYGSGYAQPHLPESLLSSPEHLTRKRRHSPKGKASGWIEECQGNKRRRNPSIYYVYKWQDETGRHSRYIPVRKLSQVQRMVDTEHRPITEVLEVLCS